MPRAKSHPDVATTVLCAVKMLSHAYGDRPADYTDDGGGWATQGILVRKYVMSRGFSEPEVIRAERVLVRQGLLWIDPRDPKPAIGIAPNVAITPRGLRKSCARVEFPPQTDPGGIHADFIAAQTPPRKKRKD